MFQSLSLGAIMSQAFRLSTLLVVALSITSCSTLLSATRSTPIEEDYGKRSFGGFIDDAFIETKAKVNLNKASKALQQAHISVTSYNGVVLLTGQVPNEQSKNLASDTVRKVRNVKRLHNELSIAGPISLPSRSNDSWLTSKVKAKLLATPKIKGNRIKVVTENGVVHLMGLLSHAEADIVVNKIKGTFGVQKIVKIFEYLD